MNVLILAIFGIGLFFGIYLIWATITGTPWIERVIAKDNFFPWPIRGRLFNQVNFIILGACMVVFCAFVLFQEVRNSLQ